MLACLSNLSPGLTPGFPLGFPPGLPPKAPPRASRVPALLALIAACHGLTGCAPAVRGPASLSVTGAQYQAAFDAACQAARAEGLVPELADRQSGEVATSATIAGSLLEPWTWGRLTANEVVEGTFGFERRRAYFEFIPSVAESTPAAANPAPLVGPILPGSERGQGTDLTRLSGPFELRVSVSVERQFRPGYQGPAYTRALGSYWRDMTDPEAGGDAVTWTPVARDERLERLLLSRVAETLSASP